MPYTYYIILSILAALFDHQANRLDRIGCRIMRSVFVLLGHRPSLAARSAIRRQFLVGRHPFLLVGFALALLCSITAGFQAESMRLANPHPQ